MIKDVLIYKHLYNNETITCNDVITMLMIVCGGSHAPETPLFFNGVSVCITGYDFSIYRYMYDQHVRELPILKTASAEHKIFGENLAFLHIQASCTPKDFMNLYLLF